MSDRVLLTPDDYAQAAAFQARMLAERSGATRNDRGADERRVHEIAGKLGEVCCGRLLCLPVDWRVRCDGDEGIDFTLRCGLTLDVKAIQVEQNMGYDFRMPLGPKAIRADILTLVLISPPHDYGDVVGVISRRRFCLESIPEREWGHRGPSVPRVLRRSVLAQHPFVELLYLEEAFKEAT